ncbi:MAG TPA: DUF805 domain-containing protein [Glycomyces sp.]|nr:DUF805 domain-containing protein [Glycomyces sp.]
MSWYLSVLKNYAEFSGRARRQEYWMFTLIQILVYAILYIPFIVTQEPLLIAPYAAYGLATFLPHLAVFMRRLHDTNRSGWWYFFGLVPLVGPIMMLVFLASEGDRGPNRYGPDPKAP